MLLTIIACQLANITKIQTVAYATVFLRLFIIDKTGKSELRKGRPEKGTGKRGKRKRGELEKEGQASL